MSSRRRHLPGALSRLVVENVRRLAGESGLPTADLIRAAGFKPNYYYVRMRQEIGFSLGDLEALARALDVQPAQLLEPGSGPGRPLRMDGAELASRLRLLLRTYGRGQAVDELVGSLRAAVPDFTAQSWASLAASDGPVSVDAGVLEAIAAHFDIDPGYLTEPVFDDAVERVKAELELQDALREAGATAVAARSLGDTPPTALRAIAAALRARPGD